MTETLPIGWTELVAEIDRRIRDKPAFKHARGTPLENDVTVWIAQAVQEARRAPDRDLAEALRLLEMTDEVLEEEGNVTSAFYYNVLDEDYHASTKVVEDFKQQRDAFLAKHTPPEQEKEQ